MIPGMGRFVHDVESVELTDDECASFADIVKSLCRNPEQHQISCLLALCTQRQGISACDSMQRQVRRMWRTELRV